MFAYMLKTYGFTNSIISFLSRIKKHIWPNVPDPSKSHIAQWSPHTPPRVRYSVSDLFIHGHVRVCF